MSENERASEAKVPRSRRGEVWAIARGFDEEALGGEWAARGAVGPATLGLRSLRSLRPRLVYCAPSARE
jgi:hypothetical protein